MKTDFSQIKASTDIMRVVESYGIRLRASGRDYVGLCPFHEDRDPSLRITPSKGLFRCPVCNVAGNVIQFVARKENISDREAALRLCRSIPGVTSGAELLTTREKKITSSLAVDEATRATLLGRVVGFYAKTLIKDRAGLEYLKSRRLDDPRMQESFRIGYCNGTVRKALPKEGEIIEQLKSIGILNERGNEVFYKRVIVPIHDTSGNVVSLYGRRLTEEEPKHLYLKGMHRGVFNGIAAKNNEQLIITEAILDAMSLWAAGWHNVISLYGKDGWTVDHDSLLQEHPVRELILALDSDERGQEAAAALEKKLSGQVKNIHHINWPEGIKDANAFFLSHSAKDFAALLPATAPPIEATREENIILTEIGFNFELGGRHYELCAIEKPSAARLKATVKVLSPDEHRFHIDTLDFYLSRSRRTFVAEVARLLREIPETIESDINRLILAVEKYVTERSEGKTGISITVPESDKLEAQRMGRSAGLIDELQRDFGKLGLIGEENNRLLIYLAMTSRKMDDPLAVQILSSSGAGKSHLQDAVLSLCPKEDLIKLTSLSGQALFYKGEESLKHKCLAIAEVAGAEGARYALRNLISDKKLVIESTIKNALSGRLETQINTVYGPTAVFETTTQPDTDPETKSRYILLSVDESPEQTRAILEAQRHSHTLESRKRSKTRENIHLKHHAFQRLLKPIPVINPFEPLLTYGSDRLSFRRDHPKYLNLILAITFLHQMQRPCKHDPELGEYIETTLEDITIANELAHYLFGQSLDELSFPSRELLRLTADYVSHRAAAENKQPETLEFTRRELREAIKWSEARLRLHLGELIKMEYIQSVSGRFGARYKHRLLIHPNEINLDGRIFPELKNIEQLGKEAQTIGLIPTTSLNLASQNPNLASRNGNLASRNGNLAGTSQVLTCEVLSTLEALKYRINGHSAENLASKPEAYIGVERK